MNEDNPVFQVNTTHHGRPFTIRVTAPNSKKAVAQARLEARRQGMERIMVRRVDETPRRSIQHQAEYGDALMEMGGPAGDPAPQAGAAQTLPPLTLPEVREMIGQMWDRTISFAPRDDRCPLVATETGSRIFLQDGASPRAELMERSRMELMVTLYEWAVHVGLTSNDLEEFLEECWG